MKEAFHVIDFASNKKRAKYGFIIICYALITVLSPFVSFANSALNTIPDSQSSLYSKAREFREKRDFYQAHSTLLKLINFFPDNPLYRYERALTFYEQIQFDSALIELNNPSGILDTFPNALRLEGLILLNKNLNDSALDLFTRVIQLKPNDTLSHKYRGIIFQKQKKFELAIGEFKKVIQLTNHDFSPHLALGIIYLQTQKLDSAAKSFNKAYNLSPDTFTTALEIGIAYQIYNQLEESERWYFKILHGNEHNIFINRQRLMIYDEWNREDSIKVISQRWIAHDSTAPIPYLSLGKLEMRKKDYNDAFTFLTQSIMKDSSCVECYDSMGTLYINKKDTITALNIFKKALHFDSLNVIKRKFLNTTTFIDSSLLFEKELEKYIKRAQLFYKYRLFDQCVKTTTMGLRLDTLNTHLLLYRLLAHFELGQLDNAYTDLLQCKSQNSSLTEIYFIQAQLCLENESFLQLVYKNKNPNDAMNSIFDSLILFSAKPQYSRIVFLCLAKFFAHKDRRDLFEYYTMQFFTHSINNNGVQFLIDSLYVNSQFDKLQILNMISAKGKNDRVLSMQDSLQKSIRIDGRIVRESSSRLKVSFQNPFSKPTFFSIYYVNDSSESKNLIQVSRKLPILVKPFQKDSLFLFKPSPWTTNQPAIFFEWQAISEKQNFHGLIPIKVINKGSLITHSFQKNLYPEPSLQIKFSSQEIFPKGFWTSEDDFSSKIKIYKSDPWLRFEIDVLDDVVKGPHPYQKRSCDTLTMCFDIREKAKSGIPDHKKGLFAIRFVPEPEKKSVILLQKSFNNRNLKNTEISSKFFNNGYRISFSINLKELSQVHGTLDERFLFNYSYSDADSLFATESRFVWSGNELEIWESPQLWGEITPFFSWK